MRCHGLVCSFRDKKTDSRSTNGRQSSPRKPGEIARALNERALDHIDEEMMLTALRDEVVQTAAMCGRMFAAVALARLRS